MFQKEHFSIYWNFVSSGDLAVPDGIDKISNINPKDIKVFPSLINKTLGKGKRAIFLVGPCTVEGINPPGERLGDQILNALEEFGLSDAYNIKFIPVSLEASWHSENKRQILSRDIKKNDIVLFLQDSPETYDLDITPYFDAYNGRMRLYTNIPMHTTVEGNRVIAKEIVKNIITPENKKAYGRYDDTITFNGIPQFSQQTIDEINKYADFVKDYRKIPQNSIVGSIVMNCNPFTLGHRYLIEQAARQVDFLYIFVVEEDKSLVPFYDRFLMVYEETKDLGNVIVVPSGKYIISNNTFAGYFRKDIDLHSPAPKEDIIIFGRYISKRLHITKRFAGTEPDDTITKNYNELMRSELPKYGVEFVEIERKRKSDEDAPISATEVIALLKNSRWEEVSALISKDVLHYLKDNRDMLLEREETLKNLYKKNKFDIEEKFINRISSYKKIVIYSVGKDAVKIINRLPEDIRKNLVFSDRNETFFNGNDIVPPEALLSKYKDYMIVVASAAHGAEIYEEFQKMGIDMSRCIFNGIRF